MRDCGCSKRTFDSATRELVQAGKITKKRVGFGGAWTWELVGSRQQPEETDWGSIDTWKAGASF